MSLYNFVSVEFFQKPKAYISSVISGIIPIVFLSGLFYAFSLWLLRMGFGDFLGLPLKYYILIPILSFLYNIKAITLTILRNNSKPIPFGLLNNSATTIFLLLAIYFVVTLDQNWEGRVNAEILAAFIMSWFSLYLLRKEGYLNLKIDKSIVKDNFKFASPLIPSLLAITIINLSDRFFIKEMVGEAELGIYAIGTSLGMMISFILYAFEQISLPLIYKKLSEKVEENNLQLVKFMNLYIAVIIVLIFGITIGVHILLEFNFLEEQYMGAKKYVFWIALAYGLWGLCTITTPFIDFHKKTKFLLYASAVGCIFNLIANYFLILKFGVIGAAYSKVATFALVLLLYWYFGNKLNPLPWFQLKSFKIKMVDFREILRL